MRIPDESVVVDGKQLTFDLTDVPVVDRIGGQVDMTVPATVSFHVTWKGRGPLRRLGKKKAADGDPAAFSGRIRTATRATGFFSGTAGSFSFQSDPSRPAKSIVAELGTEQNGSLRPGAASRCVACAAQSDDSGW